MHIKHIFFTSQAPGWPAKIPPQLKRWFTWICLEVGTGLGASYMDHGRGSGEGRTLDTTNLAMPEDRSSLLQAFCTRGHILGLLLSERWRGWRSRRSQPRVRTKPRLDQTMTKLKSLFTEQSREDILQNVCHVFITRRDRMNLEFLCPLSDQRWRISLIGLVIQFSCFSSLNVFFVQRTPCLGMEILSNKISSNKKGAV